MSDTNPATTIISGPASSLAELNIYFTKWIAHHIFSSSLISWQIFACVCLIWFQRMQLQFCTFIHITTLADRLLCAGLCNWLSNYNSKGCVTIKGQLIEKGWTKMKWSSLSKTWSPWKLSPIAISMISNSIASWSCLLQFLYCSVYNKMPQCYIGFSGTLRKQVGWRSHLITMMGWGCADMG